MAFPTSSEQDLLVALQAAPVEPDGWTPFLARLAGMTGARSAAMLRRSPHAGSSIMAQALSPTDPAAPDLAALDAILTDRMRPERIYTTDDLADLGDAACPKVAAGALLATRVAMPDGGSATVALFGDRPFAAADGAVLRRMFPYLAAAVRLADAIGRERLNARIATGIARERTWGWFALDPEGRVVATSGVPDPLRRVIRVRGGQRADRLTFADPLTEARWQTESRRMLAEPPGSEAVVRIGQEQAFHLRIVRLAAAPGGGSPDAATVTIIEGTGEVAPERAPSLATLFGLLPSEARLAAAIAEGSSLAEAAQASGITIETARNYSKKIFAKTGARGQADLVRLIHARGLARLPADPAG